MLLPTADAEAESDAFAAALVSSQMERQSGEGADLYDALLGSWDVQIVEYLPGGTRRLGEGEWHFARVLEGRAVQDVLVIPPITQRSAGAKLRPGDTYGTTLRVFEPGNGTWSITWFNPVTGLQVRLVGRREGKEIVQIGKQADGTPFRWVFSEMGPRSFRWRREVSADAGKSWTLSLEFRARRR